jgi:hypothetical protein
MKLVVVQHIQCGEWNSRSIFVAPDEMPDQEIKDHLKKARNAYQAAVDEGVKARRECTIPRPSYHFDARGYPDTMTIAEARTKWEEDKAAFDKWERASYVGQHSFDHFVSEVTPLKSYWQVDADVEYHADWAHQHGAGLKYGNEEKAAYPLNPESPETGEAELL